MPISQPLLDRNAPLSRIRRVSQVSLRLAPAEAIDPLATIRSQVLRWIQAKSGARLPTEAWRGESFDLRESGGQPATSVSIDKPRYWAARVDDGCREVALRTWITEIGLAEAPEGGVLFGCRLLVSARGDNPPFQPSIPRFVRDVIDGGNAFIDERQIQVSPWTVRSKEDVGELYALMLASNRKCDICVFSLPENSTDTRDLAASAQLVHDRTLGVAHVVILTGPAAFLLTDLVGQKFGVFSCAIRTYRPGLNFELDDPLHHPIAMAHRIGAWQDRETIGEKAFENFLVRSAINQTVSSSDQEKRMPPFAIVRQLATSRELRKAQDSGASIQDMLKLYSEDNENLQAALEEQKATNDGLLEQAGQELDEVTRRADEAKGEVLSLRYRVNFLEERLNEAGEEADESQLPSSLDDIKEWADRNLAGSVILTGRALRGAKESDYEEPSLVYEALLLLRKFYPKMRTGGKEERQAYDNRLAQLGLVDDKSISSTRRGEHGEQYRVQHQGRNCYLERHLKKGISRESRHCFRLYFFWDEENEQVIVGWLTSHLDTRKT